MFQICVIDKKIQGKKLTLRSWNFFKMQWLRTSKYAIFLILMGLKNLWNLINVFIKKIMKMFI
jgi:hypothetical protein